MIRGIRRQKETGAAMMILITLMALMATYYVVRGLNQNSTEVRTERDQRTLQALLDAKAALIAYAASQAWNPDSSHPENDQPGSLPCPAADANGTTGSCTSTASTRVGRLPWKSIGATQLRDGSGEILWYALSDNFRKAAGTTVINSDTQGTLTVTGNTPASNIVAVIIAPGQAVSGQNRAVSSVSNFLEGNNASGADTFVTASTSDIFNDQLVTITQAELMAVVEPAVATRIETDIKPDLQTYFAQWNGFPFPSSFTGGPGNPGSNTTSTTPSTRLQSAYLGDNTMTAGRGLLPVTNSVTYPWVAGSGAVAITGGTASGVTVSSCASTSSPTSGWQCAFTINATNVGGFYWMVDTCKNPGNGTRYQYCIVNPAFTVAGTVNNAGLSIAKVSPTTASDVTVTSPGGSARSMTGKSIAWALKSDGSGDATFTLSGTHSYSNYSASNFTRSMVVTIPDRLTANPVTNSADATGGWFISNEWYRQIYYVVFPECLPGGSTVLCTESPATHTRLTVSGLSSTTYPTTNDKRAILILGGHALNGTSRPSGTIANYLEGNNATPGGSDGYSYSHISGNGRTLNDRVIVISP